MGHLFLDHCKRNEHPHADMPRPNYTWFEGDWYKYDPCSDIRSAPHWYGRDIVEKILDFSENSSIEHDIGCHSFSHQMFGDPGCSEDVARADIDKCLELMKNFGLRPKTFVFPLGSAGHIKLLKEKGFTAFFSGIPQRVRGATLGRASPSVFHKYVSLGIEFLSHSFVLPPPVAIPKQVLPGLWNIPGSMCFNKKRGISNSLLVLRAKQGVERAIREKKCFYMYTHLHNFGADFNLLRCFDDVLSLAAKERKEGRLRILNMKEFAEVLDN